MLVYSILYHNSLGMNYYYYRNDDCTDAFLQLLWLQVGCLDNRLAIGRVNTTAEANSHQKQKNLKTNKQFFAYFLHMHPSGQ